MDAEVAAQILVEEYSRMAKPYEARVVPQNRTLVRRLLELARLRRGWRRQSSFHNHVHTLDHVIAHPMEVPRLVDRLGGSLAVGRADA